MLDRIINLLPLLVSVSILFIIMYGVIKFFLNRSCNTCDLPIVINNLLEAQKQLNMSRDLYKDTVDLLPIAICMLSSDGLVKFVNHKFQAYLDMPFSMILHNKLDNLPELFQFSNKHIIEYTIPDGRTINFAVIHTKKRIDDEEYDLLIEKL